jgi:long-chain acyl-CoA synthetase
MMERLWVKSYPPGVSPDPELDISMVDEILTRAARMWPEHAALDFMGRKIAYAELDRLVDRAAKGFQALGVVPGVHVGLYLPNCPQFPIAFFGVLRAGGTIVPYSPLDAAQTLEHKLADSQTQILVTLDLAALYPQIAAVVARSEVRKLVIGDLAEFSAPPGPIRAQLVAGKQIAEVAPDTRNVTFASVLDNDGAYEAPPARDPRQAIATLQYTGGTTGKPKGAILTHANLTAAAGMAEEGRRLTPAVLADGEAIVLVVLPLFHIYALSVVLLMGFRVGATLVLHVRFDPETAIKDIEAKQISFFPGVPTMFVALLHHPGLKAESLRSLKFVNSGGAPLPMEVSSAFHKASGSFVREGWGMTETAALGTFTPGHVPPRLGSCGVPAPAADIRFLSVEDSRTYLPLGERGEICIKGPNVTLGYWKNPEATRDLFTADGYMRTGDVGWMDNDGYIHIVDRTKDMLLCGGFNVYPRNIEEAIYQHPSVEAVSVIGVPDEYRGQSPKAFVKLKAGASGPSLEEMKAFLKDKLGKHEMIAAIDYRSELPRTLVGKLSKKELYEEEAKKRAG